MTKLTLRQINNLAVVEGLDLVWAGAFEAPPEASERLKAWQSSGFAGDMAYMAKPAEQYLNPANFLPGARTLLITAVHYTSQAPLKRPAGHGRVARYAWGRDYHRVLKKRLSALMRRVQEAAGSPVNYKIFSDAVPLLERAFAERAGVGIVGKNSMLIRPGKGSYFFLAEVLTDLELTDSPLPVLSGSCGPCVRCSAACPTGAITADRVVDARKCISYLTIEKRGELSPWEREALGEWIFGCDVCQEVCPFNHRAHAGRSAAPVPEEFSPAAGSGPFLSLREVLRLRSDGEFRARFAGTPLMRPKREGLVRNAACVAANTKSEELLDELVAVFEEDPSPIARQHALWAFCALNKACNISSSRRVCGYLTKASRDGSESVRREAQAIGAGAF